jgi:hypothetical protein
MLAPASYNNKSWNILTILKAGALGTFAGAVRITTTARTTTTDAAAVAKQMRDRRPAAKS